MTYSEKLKDPRWQKKRLEVLNRDNWTCQCCASTTLELQVHHLRYTTNPWEVDNNHLVTLCAECHTKVSKPALLASIRKEMSNGLMSDLYVLKNHVRYYEVEKLITLEKHIG
jgi:5-methylcytosine-specific restriction endonuclease McrA